MFRTSYSFVTQSRGHTPNALALMYFSQYAPHVSVYTPIYVASERLPPSWIRGSMHKYDTNSAWWNFNAVGNVAAHFYVYAMKSVRILQTSIEAHLRTSMQHFEENILLKYDRLLKQSGSGPGDRDHPDYVSFVDDLTRYVTAEAESISHQYKLLLPLILTKYRDGIVVSHLMDTSAVSISKDFYPKWYLRLVGYFVPGFTGPGTILTSSGPNLQSGGAEMVVHRIEYMFLLYVCIGILVGYSLHYYINELGKYLVKMFSHPPIADKDFSVEMTSKRGPYSYVPIDGLERVDIPDRPFSMVRDDI